MQSQIFTWRLASVLYKEFVPIQQRRKASFEYVNIHVHFKRCLQIE